MLTIMTMMAMMTKMTMITMMAIATKENGNNDNGDNEDYGDGNLEPHIPAMLPKYLDAFTVHIKHYSRVLMQY